jgi:hypothetical protein
VRRAARVDSNQSEIVDDLRRIPGCTVAILSAVGGGLPDILIGYRGANFLVEIKDPSKPKADQELTDDQKKFHAEWKGQVLKAFSFMDIVKFMTGI